MTPARAFCWTGCGAGGWRADGRAGLAMPARVALACGPVRFAPPPLAARRTVMPGCRCSRGGAWRGRAGRGR